MLYKKFNFDIEQRNLIKMYQKTEQSRSKHLSRNKSVKNVASNIVSAMKKRLKSNARLIVIIRDTRRIMYFRGPRLHYEYCSLRSFFGTEERRTAKEAKRDSEGRLNRKWRTLLSASFPLDLCIGEQTKLTKLRSLGKYLRKLNVR